MTPTSGHDVVISEPASTDSSTTYAAELAALVASTPSAVPAATAPRLTAGRERRRTG